MALFEKLFVLLQHLLPHRLLSRLMHGLSRLRLGPVKNLEILVFSALARVDWNEARRQTVSEYDSLNDFFTRELLPDARPVDPDPLAFVSPCDGRISQCGRITGDRIIQAKHHHYSIRSLLANDPASPEFLNGFFHTIYLSPRDYHRVHMPTDGQLLRMIHVPGRAFSVSPWTVRQVPGLFARNERVVCIFDTPHGSMAVVLVGAMLVCSMETVWSGTVTPPYGHRIQRGDWSRRDIRLRKGEEMGRFNMGSTVILLLPPGAVSSIEDLGEQDIVRMGEKLGRLR